jgi:tripartite-type tricarboxylate transporter receptor subunit TctC
MIIPWPPGQATDLIGRVLAQVLTERLGQSVVPENRGGAGGIIGTDAAAKSAPDGLTLLAASAGPVTVNPLVQRTPYDVERDLAPVALAGLSPYLLVTHPDFPARNIGEFLSVIRASPGAYTFATSGTGATAHLIAEYFNARSGLQAVHVPFQGSAPGLTALLAGQVQTLTQERDSLRSRLAAARGRIEALLDRLPTTTPDSESLTPAERRHAG